MFRRFIKNVVFSTPALYRIYQDRLLRSGKIIYYKEHLSYLEEADQVILDNLSIKENFTVGIVKDDVFNIVEDLIKPRAYYPKYERFLRNNGVNYDFFDILKSDWIEVASKFDLIIWHTASDPNTQKIAKSKIFILDKVMGIKCIPSFNDVWAYEDKINAHYLYKAKGLPEIPTFVSHDKSEINKFLEEAKFPLISKLTTGSASFGVEKINSLSIARRKVNKIFGSKGLKTYFPFERQKDYVYFQEFIEGATFDLRVITIGDKALGYYRYPNDGDFRASGPGNYGKKEIPIEALDLAFKVKEEYGALCLATDFLYSKKDDCYYIIESSIFIGVDTPSQLEIDGVSGYYLREANSIYSFVAGKYWVQELVLQEYFENNFK